MDLSKAFDCISHPLLLSKLKAYGLNDSAVYLLSSYLENRKQRVKVGDSVSCWEHISKGVPQGSILGPLLFNVFRNDIFFSVTNCSLYNYADDNKLGSANINLKNLITDLESDSLKAIEWFTLNEMEANPQKFKAIFLGKDISDSYELRIGNQTIKSQKSVKVLAIEIDNKLTFDKHISEICAKAANQVNALRRLSKHLDLPSKMAIFKHLTYYLKF